MARIKDILNKTIKKNELCLLLSDISLQSVIAAGGVFTARKYHHTL